MDLLLVTCVKTKRDSPAAARDLYVSPLFRRERRYAESRGVPWYILSAEFGLVAPDEWLAPYERYLPDTPASYRVAWGAWVTERLELLAGPLANRLVEIHASETYLAAVMPHLRTKRATVVAPLAGLGVGARLAWYDANTPPPTTPEAAADERTRPPVAPASPDSTGVADVVAALLDPRAALAPETFLQTRGEGLRRPGLYSWWVDEQGALDLTQGLDLPVAPGLVYAGLAGATRWPSGQRSSNTLWSRIAGMHLGGRHEFSTFRRTLGAVLASAQHTTTIDERALTSWMTRHLKVVTVNHDDPDTLGRLETDVLDVVNPPLNLRGMASTPVRERIRKLRRPFA